MQTNEPTYLGVLVLVSARLKGRFIIEGTNKMIIKVNNRDLVENFKKLAMVTSNERFIFRLLIYFPLLVEKFQPTFV